MGVVGMNRLSVSALCRVGSVIAALFCLSMPAQSARVAVMSPQGSVGEVRQVSLRFDVPVVAAGDPRLPAPFALSCNGQAMAGDSRWLSDKQWVLDLPEPLTFGMSCTLRVAPNWKPLVGPVVAPLEGPQEFRFSTGAPSVVQTRPSVGQAIDEDQHFLLRLNGAVNMASVAKNAWCEVEGLGERINLQVVTGPQREQLLREQRLEKPAANWLLARCDRALAPDSKVRIVWGAGITSAQEPPIVSTVAKTFTWTVRPRFTAEFSCERERANAPCLPLRPLVLRFSAPVPRSVAMGARLSTAQGVVIAPKLDKEEKGATLTEVRFAAPLPENARLSIKLPSDVKDESGRTLANASGFPLAVATGGMPPLAKFSAAPFGIVEAKSAADKNVGTEPMLPLTLRHVQADLQGASTGGRVTIKHFDASARDDELLRWLMKLERWHESELSAKELGRPASEWTQIESETDDNGKVKTVKRDRRIHTREVALLKDDASVSTRRADLPQLTGKEPQATEVIGVPLPQKGYYVVEIESRVLGHALLAQRAPMFVRTGALVTNLGVHFKRGRTSSLVWVTTLDRGQPVAGARVAVNDCNGQVMWNGNTGANGTVRIDRALDDKSSGCISTAGLFVTARAPSASTAVKTDPMADKTTVNAGDDLSFVFSGWNKGIEAWRFNLPTASSNGPERFAHTVFDRSLLRAGETVSMKHFVRDANAQGLALAKTDTLPEKVIITHIGSGTETSLLLSWPRGARSSESRWEIPASAKLGLYDVALVTRGPRGAQRLASGSLRVEAFRVPLVDARLAGPKGLIVAPKDINLAVQINMLAGGPLARTPAAVSALLRNAQANFPGYEDYQFLAARNEPAGDAQGSQDSDEAGRVVANKLNATTDAQGAATVSIGKLPAITQPTELVAELSFNDPNGEVQTVSQRLRLWPSSVVVGLRAKNWTGSAKGEMGFDAVVLDTQGRALKDRTVEVRGQLRETFSTRKRIVGGFYAYDNTQRTKDLGVLCKGKSDAQGRVACSTKTDEVGEIELTASSTDDAGYKAQASTSLWTSGDGEQWFAQDNDDRIDVLPEQREVEPGKTARLQVRMPFHEATALVTIERDGVIDSRVMTLRGREPVIELPIPLARPVAAAGKDVTSNVNSVSWAPNVMVSVLVLRGRVRDVPWTSFFSWGWREPAQWWRAFRFEGREWRAPTAMADLAKPSFRLGVAELRVGLAGHRLDVKVSPERGSYGVRETVKTLVTVTHNGRPAANAEVAFAAVDEGLLALRANDSWNLLEAMMRRRAWGVETATAQGEIIGRRHYGRKAMSPGGDGGANPTRELFDTLLLWRGTVQLDAKGQASIDVPLNDSLTSFRLVAVADEGMDNFGTGSATVRVTQDLQIFSGLPPWVRDGDRFDAVVTLRNTTARAMTVKTTLTGQMSSVAQGEAEARGFPLALPEQSMSLAAGAAAEVRWTVDVPLGATRLVWAATALESGGKAADRMKFTQAVLPVVPVRVWQAALAPLDGIFSMPLAPPADALPALGAKSGGVQVTLQNKLGNALPGLRRYFETYPYSCLEQKTSRALALHDAPRWAALKNEVSNYLDADGLASYFVPRPEDPARGSDRLTAYLITAAHEAGQSWPDAARESMLAGLAAFVEGRTTRRFYAPREDLDMRKLAALEALSRHGRATPRMLGSLAITPATWPTSALLDWWAVLRRVDAIPERAARLAEVQNHLRSRLTWAGSTLKFSTEDSDHWGWLMDGPDSNAARLLLAATELPEWKDEVPKLVTGHLGRQRLGAWSTTTANLWSVLALERFSAKFEATPVAGRTQLTWGSVARAVDWKTVGDKDAQVLPWPANAAAANPVPLQATHQGSGKPWLTVQTLAAVPLKAPLFAGYRISRSVSAVERAKPDVWTRGDVLRVRVEIEARSDMSWVVINDALPAGAALLGGGLGRDSAMAVRGERREGAGWLAFEERAQDAWRAYYEWLPRGKHVAEYTMRLNASGRFALPPTRVEAMYASETFGETPNLTLEVR